MTDKEVLPQEVKQDAEPVVAVPQPELPPVQVDYQKPVEQVEVPQPQQAPVYGYAPQPQQTPAYGYAPQPQYAPVQQGVAFGNNDSTLAIVFAVLSVIMGPLLSIPGIIFANRALKVNPADSMSKAAKLISWIVAGVYVAGGALYLIFFFFLFLGAAMTGA